MARIKNWRRLESKERSTRPYYWKNTENSDVVTVTELSSKMADKGEKYRISKNRGSTVGAKTLGTASTKEKARKWAVRWMRRNP